jgi:hypothetical protein
MRTSQLLLTSLVVLLAILAGLYHRYTHIPPNPAEIVETSEFSNFAGTVSLDIAGRNKFSQPRTEEGIIDIVEDAILRGHVVRVFGAGHSWTPLVGSSKGRPTHLINLDNYNRLVAVDKEKMQATVQAGIRLRQLTRVLASVGLGLSNMGTIDEQSIAGAISTSTHGSGMIYTFHVRCFLEIYGLICILLFAVRNRRSIRLSCDHGGINAINHRKWHRIDNRWW